MLGISYLRISGIWDLGFRPCYADTGLGMRYRGDHYEFIKIMVDDLLIFSKDFLSSFKLVTDEEDEF